MMSNKYRPSQYADQRGSLIESHIRNMTLLSEGPTGVPSANQTVPPDGTPGFQEGALYWLRGGPSGGALFQNQGTQTSCLFRPISMAVARQIPGVAGAVAPGATGADNVVGVITIPANYFGLSGQGIYFTASGNFAATANNKRVKLIFNPATAVIGSTVGAGGTTLADTGVVATNNQGWLLEGAIIKRGSLGANTQTTISVGAVAGTSNVGILLNVDTVAVETAAILVAVTINNTTAASDASMDFFEADAWN